MSTFTGQEVHPLGSQGKHLQRQVHATHQRPGDHLVLRRRHHLLHPHGEDPRAEQTVSVHVPLRDSLRGAEDRGRRSRRVRPVRQASPSTKLFLLCVSPDYDRTKRPLHLPVVRGRRHGAMVRPAHQDQLHQGRLQRCTTSTLGFFFKSFLLMYCPLVTLI